MSSKSKRTLRKLFTTERPLRMKGVWKMPTVRPSLAGDGTVINPTIHCLEQPVMPPTLLILMFSWMDLSLRHFRRRSHVLISGKAMGSMDSLSPCLTLEEPQGRMWCTSAILGPALSYKTARKQPPAYLRRSRSLREAWGSHIRKVYGMEALRPITALISLADSFLQD